VRVSDSPPSSRPAGVPLDDDTVRAKIAEVAYLRWLDRGCAPGHATEDWLAAEREVHGEPG
jgi:hypothetical protein